MDTVFVGQIDAGRQAGRGGTYIFVSRTFVFVVLFAVAFSVARPAQAQNWSFDARRIALGGIGDTENAALGIVAEQRGYAALVLPFGMFQVFRDLSVYDPTDARFDPVRAAEYLASPLHYTFNRDGSTSGQQFVFDIVNALLSRDLNTYKGFTPSPQYLAEGLASPSFGKTFRVWRGDQGAFQGFYVGAGPYFALKTDNRFDDDLVDILDSTDDVYIPNANLFVTSQTTPQFALALTGGYRARIAGPSLSALGSDRNGIYLAANYHYLFGFRYEDYNMAIRFDTDGQGLVTVAPTTLPLAIGRHTSSRGRGMAVDVGTVLVVDRWDFGFGINGIGNQITWTGVEREGFFLESLVDGGSFIQVPLGPTGEDLRVEPLCTTPRTWPIMPTGGWRSGSTPAAFRATPCAPVWSTGLAWSSSVAGPAIPPSAGSIRPALDSPWRPVWHLMSRRLAPAPISSDDVTWPWRSPSDSTP